MNCLDLFSGIGGFAWGLRAIARPVAYCDCNSFSHSVLTSLMSRRLLCKAPIYSDVRTLDPRALREKRVPQPEMITAGFPCQDVSVLHDNGLGIHGLRSRLFFEIPRLAKEIPSVQHVLLENSPSLYKRGLHEVVTSLQSAGFAHIVYGVFSAFDVGARHLRRRWYCLASRAPKRLPLMTQRQLEQTLKHDFDGSTPRVIPRTTDKNELRRSVRRITSLGNAVVPQTVAFAYQTLAKTLRDASIRARTSLVAVHGSHVPHTHLLRLHTISGAVVDVPRPNILPTSMRNLPCAHTRAPLLSYMDDEGNILSKQLWPTPRNSEKSYQPCKRFTPRCMRNLGNLIFHEVNTRCPGAPTIRDRPKYCIINPRFIERLMGFPRDWTKTDAIV